MPVQCAVKSCRRVKVDGEDSFFCFPAVRSNCNPKKKCILSERINRWKSACGITTVANFMRICGDHFVGGKPAASCDTTNIDWIPSLLLPEQSVPLNSTSNQFTSGLEYEIVDGRSFRSLEPLSEPFYLTLVIRDEEDYRYEVAYCGIFNPDSFDIAATTGMDVSAISSASDCAADECNTVQLDESYHQYYNIPFDVTVTSSETTAMDVSALSSGSGYAAEYNTMQLNESHHQCYDIPFMELNVKAPTRVLLSAEQMIDDFVDEDTSQSTIIDVGPNCGTDRHLHKNTSNSANITVFKESVGVQTNHKWLKDAAVQERANKKLLKQNRVLQNTVQQLRTKLTSSEESTRYTVTALEKDDIKCKYITGIKSSIVLRQLYESVKQDLPPYDEPYLEQIFILALRKLRLNEPFCTLSLIYGMHHSTVADKIFEIIHCIYPFMSGLVHWPPRDVIKKHMPASFEKKYGDRITIIIDCFEIPIESPRSEEMIANANVYSFYKHHKTVKVLAGITPAGTIAFVSEAFGGRTSDQQVTRMSGFLELIEEGDFVLADRGFLINEMLTQKKAVLNIPAFKKANHQLEPLDACHSRDLASLRIHVERLIGSMRQKCLILSNLIPITLLERWNGDMPVLDQIIKIAAAIVNLCPSVVTQ